MVDKKAAPPDDGGHTGSMTTPEQTMIEGDVQPQPGPAVVRRSRIGWVPAIIAVTILLLFMIIVVFMPRP
jgi:hypothetical protein